MTTFARVILLLAAIVLFALSSQTTAYTLKYKTKRINKELGKVSDYVLNLDTELHDVLTEKPRNYSAMVVLTALAPEFGCQPCKDFDSEFRTLAHSFARSKSSHPLYFGVLDFQQGREVFQRLNIQTAPIVFLFPPTEGPHAREISGDFEIYDVARKGLGADALATFVSSKINEPIKIVRPLNYPLIGISIVLFLGFIATVKYVARSVVWLLSNKKVWAVGSLGTILLMTSGFMWNRIRNPPYVSVSQNGKPEYIVGGFQQQVAIETQISAALNGVCALTVVALSIYVPTVQSAFRQRILVLTLTSAMVIVYSVLIVVFKIKSPGYPFKLLL